MSLGLLLLAAPSVGVVVPDDGLLEPVLARVWAGTGRDAVDVGPRGVRVESLRVCAGDAACFARAARAAGVDWLLYVSHERVGETGIVALRFVDAAGTTTLVAEPFESSIPVLQGIHALLPRSFPPGAWREPARLEIETEPAGAIATLGPARCTTPCTLEPVPAGRVELSIALGEVAEVEVLELAAGEQRRLTLSLERRRWWTSPYLWIAVGAVAAGSAVAVWAATRPGPDSICFAPARADCR